MPRNRSPLARVHIVLVPGFCGFDALGQLEYYSGVTPQFRRWKKSLGNHRTPADLHYFDNFPTAGVHTRAGRLRSYLVKRIARGEFLPGDRVALIGHSTGGLDIRWLLWDLAAAKNRMYPADPDFMVGAEEVLELIKRVVFLSVPQWGTNIADWVRSYRLGRKVVLADLRGGFACSQVPFVDRLEEWIWNCTSTTTNLGLAHAVRDTVAEAEAGTSHDPTQIALAEEAASEVQLWLRYVASDFHAIDDLAVLGDDCPPESPARFDEVMRQEERENWRRHDIVTRSYATLGPRPFKFIPGEEAPRWNLLNPLTYPECTSA